MRDLDCPRQTINGGERVLIPLLSHTPLYQLDLPRFFGEGVALAAELGLAKLPPKLDRTLSDDGILALSGQDGSTIRQARDATGRRRNRHACIYPKRESEASRSRGWKKGLKIRVPSTRHRQRLDRHRGAQVAHGWWSLSVCAFVVAFHDAPLA